MGSEFWDTFSAGADATLETLGERVTIGGREMMAVVQSAAAQPELVPGGVSPGATLLLHVCSDDGNGIADGDKARARGMDVRVIRKDAFGGGWMIHAGPANRWDGDLG